MLSDQDRVSRNINVRDRDINNYSNSYIEKNIDINSS